MATIEEKIKSGREYRAMTLQVRAAETDKQIVEGYATTFNQPYVLYESNNFKVIEVVDPTAFNGCDMSDVIMQYNHEGRVFARNTNGTLILQVNEVGLKVIADLGGTEIGRQLYQEIKGGYTDKMSFGFIVEDDREETVDENDFRTITRTITKISKLFDVSAVSIPANDGTSISARQYSDGVIGRLEAERLLRAQKIKKIKLKMELENYGKKN